MSLYRFSQRSIERMNGVHPELVLIASRALMYSEVDFGVTEGLRTESRQRELVEAGKSQTMKSRHLTGDALDVAAYVDGQLTWDWDKYEEIARAFKRAAEELGIAIEWGGDWRTLKDGPHFQRAWNGS
ncbi:M15 family metallopeptidase [Marinobacterium litorale]|uniref:M15 family metallopeptidase n=1 Tax=Marinobacterium litorale TaxID=404770 RepID=UPI0004033E20|nr:M15 family metallopeptidase [Marinobacterium litorale]